MKVHLYQPKKYLQAKDLILSQLFCEKNQKQEKQSIEKTAFIFFPNQLMNPTLNKVNPRNTTKFHSQIQHPISHLVSTSSTTPKKNVFVSHLVSSTHTGAQLIQIHIGQGSIQGEMFPTKYFSIPRAQIRNLNTPNSEHYNIKKTK